MDELRLLVPTYNAAAFEEEVANGELPDFGDPYVPMLIRPAEGIHIVLGSHRFDDSNAPDIQIERRPNGWAIFLHPLGGGDPSGYVYFVDDGRSFLVRESGRSGTPVIEVLCSCEEVPDVDAPW